MKNKYYSLKNDINKIIKKYEFPDGIALKNAMEIIYDNKDYGLRRLSKIGNLKIGLDTLIFNMGSAYDCPSDKLGLCKLSEKCYAKKAETQYWLDVTAYREKQAKYWKEIKAGYFAADLIDILEKNSKLKYLRFNESGDFYSQKDIEKLIEIAKIIKIFKEDFIIYTYTARSDLDFSNLPDNLIINGSSFMIDNNFTFYNHEKELKKEDKICKDNCAVCNYCKRKGKNIIKVKIH